MAVPEQGRDQTDGKGRRTEHSHPNTAEGLRRKADRKQQPERQQIHQRRRAEDRAAAGFDPHALARLDRKRRARRHLYALADGSAAAAVAAVARAGAHTLHQQADAPVREQGSDRCTLPHRQASVLPPSVSLSETCTVYGPPMTPAETFAGSATSSSTCLAAAS